MGRNQCKTFHYFFVSNTCGQGNIFDRLNQIKYTIKMNFSCLKNFYVATKAWSSMWTDMKQRQVNKASFEMVFTYHSIFTNAHKRYVYKVINQKPGRIYTILFSFTINEL